MAIKSTLMDALRCFYDRIWFGMCAGMVMGMFIAWQVLPRLGWCG